MKLLKLSKKNLNFFSGLRHFFDNLQPAAAACFSLLHQAEAG
jgi:hypothetical protein